MARKRNPTINVRVDELRVHPSAQRKLVPSLVKKIMAVLDLDALGTFHVVKIDDQLWIIDGQHRWHALMKHGLGEWRVRCEIHEDVTDHARASDLFIKLNTRATIASYDLFANEVEAGHPGAVNTKKLAERYGFRVDRQAGDGHISCVTTLKRVYEWDEGRTLDETFDVVTAAHGKTAAAVEGKYLEGLAQVLRRYNGEVDRDALTKKLSKHPGGAAGVIGDAKGLKRIRRASLATCVAEVVIASYNSGRRSGRISA